MNNIKPYISTIISELPTFFSPVRDTGACRLCVTQLSQGIPPPSSASAAVKLLDMLLMLSLFTNTHY